VKLGNGDAPDHKTGAVKRKTIGKPKMHNMTSLVSARLIAHESSNKRAAARLGLLAEAPVALSV
jgi:hypothetical protein